MATEILTKSKYGLYYIHMKALMRHMKTLMTHMKTPMIHMKALMVHIMKAPMIHMKAPMIHVYECTHDSSMKAHMTNAVWTRTGYETTHSVGTGVFTKPWRGL